MHPLHRSLTGRPSTQRVEFVVVFTTWLAALLIMRLASTPSSQLWISAVLIALAASLAISAVLAFPLPSVMLNTPRLGAARRITEATSTSLLIGIPLAIQSGVVVGNASTAIGFAILTAVTWFGLALSTSVVPLPVTRHEPMLRSDLRRPVYPRRRRLRGAKRLLDLTASIVALVLTLPLLVLTALIIVINDRGPVLFTQERIGRHGRPFRIYKFRSMVTEAEYLKRHLADSNERKGPLFKLSNDPRITPVGRVIRQLSIDELPQLLNVIKGEMSLVGPRPALAEELEEFHPVHRDSRLLVKPGITGLWQAEARSDPDFSRVEELDTRYVREWSATLDLWILVATVIEVFRTLIAIPLARIGIKLTAGEQMVVADELDADVDVIDVVIPFPDALPGDAAPVSGRAAHQSKTADQSAKVS